MISTAAWWFILNLLTVLMLAFYSMLEMACVSFNKVRLQFYVNKGIKQAVWLNHLLHDPARLFGTTLIGVSIATVVGSECSRQFYSALGLNPDFSPLSQVLLVVIIGELAPMFAARRYAESVVMLGMPLLYASVRLMQPLIWVISQITRLCHFFIGGKHSEAGIFLSQEELLKLIEEQETSDEFGDIAANIFKLRHLTAWDIMEPLTHFPLLDSSSTIKEMREMIAATKELFFPVFHQKPSHIVGIAFPRDMLRASENQRARDYSRSVWFITYNMTAMEILQQFKRNRQNVAVVINDQGAAIGIIHLDTLIDEVIRGDEEEEEIHEEQPRVIIERTLSGEMTVGEFNKQFDVVLDSRREMTLSELIIEKFGSLPEAGDKIYIEPYELCVKEMTMMDVKEVDVTTLLK